MKTYAKGRRLEYKVKKMLEDDGWFVVRCAGSKPVDLIAVGKGQILIVECKAKKVTRQDRKKLDEILKRIDGMPIPVTGRIYWKTGWGKIGVEVR